MLPLPLPLPLLVVVVVVLLSFLPPDGAAGVALGRRCCGGGGGTLSSSSSRAGIIITPNTPIRGVTITPSSIVGGTTLSSAAPASMLLFITTTTAAVTTPLPTTTTTTTTTRSSSSNRHRPLVDPFLYLLVQIHHGPVQPSLLLLRDPGQLGVKERLCLLELRHRVAAAAIIIGGSGSHVRVSDVGNRHCFGYGGVSESRRVKSSTSCFRLSILRPLFITAMTTLLRYHAAVVETATAVGQ
jgi:hypothetical protein